MKTIVLLCFSLLAASMSMAQEIYDLDDEVVEVEAVEEFVEYPFAVVEVPPLFKGCEKESKEDQKACFEKKFKRFIDKKIKYPKGVTVESPRAYKVYAIFKVDTKGRLSNIAVRAQYPAFKKEIERVLNKLPQLKPAMHRGKAVVSTYTFTIDFSEYKR